MGVEDKRMRALIQSERDDLAVQRRRVLLEEARQRRELELEEQERRREEAAARRRAIAAERRAQRLVEEAEARAESERVEKEQMEEAARQARLEEIRQAEMRKREEEERQLMAADEEERRFQEVIERERDQWVVWEREQSRCEADADSKRQKEQAELYAAQKAQVEEARRLEAERAARDREDMQAVLSEETSAAIREAEDLSRQDRIERRAKEIADAARLKKRQSLKYRDMERKAKEERRAKEAAEKSAAEAAAAADFVRKQLGDAESRQVEVMSRAQVKQAQRKVMRAKREAKIARRDWLSSYQQRVGPDAAAPDMESEECKPLAELDANLRLLEAREIALKARLRSIECEEKGIAEGEARAKLEAETAARREAERRRGELAENARQWGDEARAETEALKQPGRLPSTIATPEDVEAEVRRCERCRRRLKVQVAEWLKLYKEVQGRPAEDNDERAPLAPLVEALGALSEHAEALAGRPADIQAERAREAREAAEQEAQERAAAEEQALKDAEAKRVAEEENRRQAREYMKQKVAAMERAKAEAEAKRAAQARLKAAENESARLAAEEEVRARTEAEAKARAEAEAREQAHREAEKRAEAEAEEKAELEARAKAEAEARTKAEEEAKMRAEAMAKAADKVASSARRREADAAKARVEAETRQLAAAKARGEEQDRLRAEAEAESKQRTEAAARARKELEERLKTLEAASKAKREADARDAEINAAVAAENEARAAEERCAAEAMEAERQAEAEAKVQLEAAQQARDELDAKMASLEGAAKAKLEAAQVEREKRAAARAEAAAKSKREAEERRKRMAEARAKAKQDAEANIAAQREAAQRAAAEAAAVVERARNEAEIAKKKAQARLKAQAEANRAAEAAAKAATEAERRAESEKNKKRAAPSPADKAAQIRAFGAGLVAVAENKLAAEVSNILDEIAQEGGIAGLAEEEEDLDDEDDGEDDGDGLDPEKMPGWSECLSSTLPTSAHAAAYLGHYEVLEYLCLNFDVFDTMGSNGRTPIFYAALAGHVDCLALLLSLGGAEWIDVGDVRGDTALHAACLKGHTAAVRFLIEEGEVYASTANGGGLTPAHLVPDEETLRLLLEKNVEVCCVDNDGRMPLWHACAAGRDRIVAILLEDPQVRQWAFWPDTKCGDSALHAAARSGHGECCAFICEAMWSWEVLNAVNDKGYTPAHVAVNAEALQALYESGADIFAEDPNLRTPLFHAALKGVEDNVDLLIEAAEASGAEYETLDRAKDGPTADDHVSKWATDPVALVGKADVNGDTPLHAACLGGHYNCIELMLKYSSAAIDALNKGGHRPDQLAEREGHSACANMIGWYYADGTVDGSGTASVEEDEGPLLAALSVDGVKAGDRVTYVGANKVHEAARIVKVHFDDVEPYFTVLIDSSGNERQTDIGHLFRAAAGAAADDKVEAGVPPVAAASCRWTKQLDNSSGHVYYLDNSTGESQWDRPADYDERETPAQLQARRTLEAFYREQNPAALGRVDAILLEAKGKESDLFERLAAKYGDAAVRSAEAEAKILAASDEGAQAAAMPKNGANGGGANASLAASGSVLCNGGAAAIDPLARLEAFYRLHNPEKVHLCAAILKERRGKEKELFAQLAGKYGAEALRASDAQLATTAERAVVERARRRLVRFYELQNRSDQLDKVDAILAEHRGKEDTLFARLASKYGQAAVDAADDEPAEAM